MSDKIVIKILVGEDSCALQADCMGKKPFCRIDRDDDSCNAAKKILKCLGFRVKIEDGEEEQDEDEDEDEDEDSYGD